METELMKYTPNQRERRNRDKRIYRAYVSMMKKKYAPGSIIRKLMDKYKFKSRTSVYYAVERGKQYVQKDLNNKE